MGFRVWGVRVWSLGFSEGQDFGLGSPSRVRSQAPPQPARSLLLLNSHPRMICRTILPHTPDT